MNGIIEKLQKLHTDQRGNVGWIVIFAGFILIIIPLIVIFVDYFYVIMIDEKYNDIVDEINLDAYLIALDIEHTAYNTNFRVKEDEAYEFFRNALKARFRLDDSLNPLPNSPLNGPIIIEKYAILYPGDQDGHGRTMENYGIVSDILIPVKTPLIEIEGNKPIFVTTEIAR